MSAQPLWLPVWPGTFSGGPRIEPPFARRRDSPSRSEFDATASLGCVGFAGSVSGRDAGTPHRPADGGESLHYAPRALEDSVRPAALDQRFWAAPKLHRQL